MVTIKSPSQEAPMPARFLSLTVGLGMILLPGTGRGVEPPPVSGTALVRLIEQVAIPAEAAGVFRRFVVKEGDRVAQGDLLGELDLEEAEVALERARLELRSAEKLAESTTSLRKSQTALEESLAVLERARVEHDVARRRAKSELALLGARANLPFAEGEFSRAVTARRTQRDSVSQTEYEQLKLAVDKARLDLQQAEENREISQLLSTSREHEVAGLQAAVNRHQAAVDQSREEHELAGITRQFKSHVVVDSERALRRRQIRSPLAGVVVRRQANPGEWVSPGDPIVRVVNLDRLRVETFYSTRQADALSLGLRVEFVPQGPADERSHPQGEIVFISPEVDPVTGQVLVWAEFDNQLATPRLRPGQRGLLRVVADTPTAD
jgi:multidrug efflux pump subunit AcrA (membrane-fusion protein)